MKIWAEKETLTAQALNQAFAEAGTADSVLVTVGSTFVGPRLYRQGQLVVVDGSFARSEGSATWNIGTALIQIGTIPAGFRPISQQRITARRTGSNTNDQLEFFIQPSGSVTVRCTNGATYGLTPSTVFPLDGHTYVIPPR